MDTVTSPLGQAVVTVDEPDPDDQQFWSVTTIIDILDKPGLIYWSAEEAAKASIDSERTWKALLADQGRDVAVKWLRDARFRQPKGYRSATALGTEVHAVCEEYALTGKRPEVDDEVRPFLDQFDDWLQHFQPSYQATEVAVYSPTYGYAGTTDAFMTIDGIRFIVDYKSSKTSTDDRGQLRKPYPEQVGLQLAAYRHAELAAVWRPRRFERFRRRYYLLSPQEQAAAVPVPEVDMGLVLHITPEHCMAYPIRCDEDVHQAFLFVLEGARWVNETSKRVMGRPLEVNR